MYTIRNKFKSFSQFFFQSKLILINLTSIVQQLNNTTTPSIVKIEKMYALCIGLFEIFSFFYI